MRFRIEQQFPADPATLCLALVDPSYLSDAIARLPDVAAPIVVSQRRDAETGAVHQAVRYAFTGHLPGAVTRVVSPERLTWIEDSTVDVKGMSAAFRIVPEYYKNLFTCSGTWSLTLRPGGCSRVIEGSMKVNSPIPFVGGQVEKAIVGGLRDRLDKEPAAFTWWISQRR